MVEVTVLVPQERVAEFYAMVGKWLDNTNDEPIKQEPATNNKYYPLYQHLTNQEQRTVTLTFDEIESILGRTGALPPSSKEHRAWWANTDSHVQAKAWLAAGWRITHIDLDGHPKSVTLQR